jgi:hypothetical protein
LGKALEFASLVAKYNSQSAELHAKIIPLYLAKSKQAHSLIHLDKIFLALKSLICLNENHAANPKTEVAKARFFKHWLDLSEEQRKKAIPDERLYKSALSEIASLGAPTNTDGLEKVAETLKAKAAKDITAVNEYIKLRMKIVPKAGEKYEDLALAALTQESSPNKKIYAAENLYRRVLKSGAKGESFKAKAKELFKFSETFQQ